MTKPILQFPCKFQARDFEQRNGEHYCAQCSKQIVDFRSASVEEIQQASTEKDICGIFNTDQIDYNTLQLSILPQQRFRLSIFGILGITAALSSSCEDDAQLELGSKIESEDQPFDWVQQLNQLKFPLTVRGTVVNEKDETPLQYTQVSIYHKGKQLRWTNTDVLGNFEMILELQDLESDTLDFQLWNDGNEKKEAHLLSEFSQSKSLTLSLQIQPIETTEANTRYIEFTDIPMISGSIGRSSEYKGENKNDQKQPYADYTQLIHFPNLKK